MTDVLVIGAGPYGLSAAHAARRLGLSVTVLGRPMSFWREHMPAGMYLRSGPDWHLDVAHELTFEAFAGVVLASVAALGIDEERVNVNGGAVALGHPLAASGLRLVLTLAYELRRRGGGLGVATLCGGGGQGEAILLRV